MNNNPLVSAIITTRNEAGVIKRALFSLQEQKYKNLETILVDNNSTDGTVKMARKLGAKVYNFGPERSAQRNFGAKKARGKYLLFLDADMELTSTVIEECVAAVAEDRENGAVIIPEKSVAHTFWEKVKAFERSFYNERGDPITDAARFFKREVFFKAGGYDETITGPEDWDLPETVREKGYKIGRIQALIYHYERVPSLFSLAQKKIYYGLRAHRYLAKHNISAFSPKTIYFLRPVFWKNWKKLVSHPLLSFSMFIMLSVELVGGGVGYLLGRLKRL